MMESMQLAFVIGSSLAIVQRELPLLPPVPEPSPEYANSGIGWGVSGIPLIAALAE
jgi:hypothetical protein